MLTMTCWRMLLCIENSFLCSGAICREHAVHFTLFYATKV